MRALLPPALLLAWPGAPPEAADLVVCSSGSAGCYPDIQDAVDAAGPGDTILVLGGDYTPFVLDEPIRVIGAGPAEVRVWHGPGVEGIVVEDLPPWTEAVVSGITVLPEVGAVDPTDASPGVLVRNNEGRVVLERIVAENELGPAILDHGPALTIEKTAYAMVDDCTLRGADGNGADGMRVISSTVFLGGTSVRGGSPPVELGPHGGSGIRLWKAARLAAAHCDIRGGDGALSLELPVEPVGGPAIVAHQSSVILQGGPGSVVRGGHGGWGVGADGGTLFGEGGHALELSNASSATWSAAFPPEGGFSMTGVQQPASVSADASSKQKEVGATYPTLDTPPMAVDAGEPIELSLHGEPGDGAVLFAWTDSITPYVLPGADGLVFVPYGAVLIEEATTLSPSGEATLVVDTPPALPWTGTVLFLQFVEVGAGPDRYSNPAVVVGPK